MEDPPSGTIALLFTDTRESVELAHETGDKRLEMRTAVGLIQTLINHGRLTEADAAIGATRELLDRQSTATWSGDIALIRGDNGTAVGHYAESLQIAAREGDIIQV